MVVLAQTVLPQTAFDGFIIMSVVLAIVGTLFLAYDLLGRENGPLRWFTLVIICGLVSVPLALACGVLLSLWRFIHWEVSTPQPHVFSRKGFLVGFVIGFIPWLMFLLLQQNFHAPAQLDVPELIVGLQGMAVILLIVIAVGVLALASAAAGSISQYILWKANMLPLRRLGVLGLALILVATSLQGGASRD